MSEKTLGQVYREGCDEARRLFPSSPYDRESYAHVALIRAVLAERDKSAEFALRAMQIPRVIAAARQEMEREPAKPVSPTSGTINTGPIIACDVKQEQPEAGDWAMGAANWVVTLYETTGIVTSSEIASRIREAAERHYGEKIMDLQMKLIEANNKLLEKVRTPSQLEHARRLADRLDAIEKERDAARAECERLLEKLNTAEANLQEYRELVPAAPADAGEDELRKAVEAVLHGYSVYGATDFLSLKVIAAVRPLFDAVLAERDEAIKAVECHKSYHDTERAIKRAETAERERDTLKMYLQGAEVYQRESRECHAMLTGKGEMAWCMVHPTGELETDLGKEVLAVRQRAESAESERDRIAAELAEMKGLRDAMEWSLKNTAVGWSVQNSEWEVWQNGIMIAKAKDRTDAILAAFRAKGKEPQA